MTPRSFILTLFLFFCLGLISIYGFILPAAAQADTKREKAQISKTYSSLSEIPVSRQSEAEARMYQAITNTPLFGERGYQTYTVIKKRPNADQAKQKQGDDPDANKQSKSKASVKKTEAQAKEISVSDLRALRSQKAKELVARIAGSKKSNASLVQIDEVINGDQKITVTYFPRAKNGDEPFLSLWARKAGYDSADPKHASAASMTIVDQDVDGTADTGHGNAKSGASRKSFVDAVEFDTWKKANLAKGEKFKPSSVGLEHRAYWQAEYDRLIDVCLAFYTSKE